MTLEARPILESATSPSEHSPSRTLWPEIDVHLDTLVPAMPPTASPPQRTAGRSDRTPTQPAWSRFEPAVRRVPATYLAFRSLEHLTGYLRIRATLGRESSTG